MANYSLQERAARISQLLKQQFPALVIPLHHRNAFELLIATILSAQTTDVRVNSATPVLFGRYPNAAALARADQSDVEDIIKPIGLYHTKAKSIIATARMLESEFQGKVPATMGELMRLPGVGRKVASVVAYQAFGHNEGFTVDTHVLRLAQNLGLTKHTDPAKVEQDLMKLFPQSEWGDTSLRLILLGRSQLPARSPQYLGTVWEEFFY